jgi:hypothetical protein
MYRVEYEMQGAAGTCAGRCPGACNLQPGRVGANGVYAGKGGMACIWY